MNMVPELIDEYESRTTTGSGLQFSFAYAKRQGVLLDGHTMDNNTINNTETGSDKIEKQVIYCRDDVEPLTLSELNRKASQPLLFKVIAREDFEARLRSCYGQQDKQAIKNIELGDDVDLLSVAQQLAEPEDLLESEDDAPIIRLINAILAEAIKENASDIHIEPYEQRLVVRLRVDGILREVIQPPRELSNLLVSRIKVMAQLDIAEKRIPQDGRISLKLAGKAIDVRVSTLPTGVGERVVLRLLDNQAGRLHLDNMGMDQSIQEHIRELVARPHGFFLVTGPTGSGKTTSLYAILNELNNGKRNIITVEDPIEYYLEGIGQTQVNTRVDLTFSRGLRAILRQDPDVVMVGEIRDGETADIAVQASLTGHMVLSTLHTNTAIASITRLRDMGLESFLLSSSLAAVLAQRLVRVLCPDCKKAYTPSESETKKLGLNLKELMAEASNKRDRQFYQAQGCPQCNYQGYKGRTGIYELLKIDNTISSMIHDDVPEYEIEAYARKTMPSILQDGVRLIRSGITSSEEVFRVIKQSD